ncbi:ALG9 [[Candida] subhashii]|uniref:Mannosyltransferase n=1 Tax=[Candida] subhashii TaxID=561895 RepID=A0A8J5UMN7_9ASCO|nr:ALG9 [[Candida] subhashii]KAG7666213.1 ALG9 [[Candida] subhashii]
MRLTPIQYALIGLNIAYRLYSAIYMIIADCDETYNYWEPLNLLLRNFGKQTWEYSPEFKIRSYSYLIPYYIIGKFFQYFNIEPMSIFYGIRIIALSGMTSLCELILFKKLLYHSNSIANWWLLFSSIAPGMSHAGVALLPSTLAMQTTILAMSCIVEMVKKSGSSRQSPLIGAIFWYLVGGLLGWPFSFALGLPIGVYTLSMVLTKKIPFGILIKCFGVLLIVIIPIIVIDSIFYQKFPIFIPANIVLYNVFGGEGEGPEIFGVEPVSYYIFNLILNFHVLVPLSCLGIFFNPFITQLKSLSLFISSQLVIWCSIFFLQPHKEERFLYPIYPLISLSAAIFLSKINNFIKKRINIKLIQIGFIISIIALSSLRIFNLVENYSAPLTTFQIFSESSQVSSYIEPQNVCMGKEWYHFPTSFFLPDNYRLRYVDCGFDGLLPGDFHESSSSLIDSTTFIPPHMNNKNQFEVDKIISLEQCDYFVDNSQVRSQPKLINPDLSLVDEQWKLLTCNKILNPEGNHNLIGKLIYIPKVLRKLIPYKVEYMEFCVLKRQS